MMSKGRCIVCKLVGLLVVIGALNWGLVGIAQWDLVESLLGRMTLASRAVYTVIGVAGLAAVISCFKCCPCAGRCDTKPTSGA